jgi:phosphoserine phosphatase RsbU/P
MNKKQKILIVDDEPFNVDYLEQELEDLNYETISAVNGQDALEKIASESPDLILLDIMMPVMDGYAVLEKVKADPAMRNIPIIVASANNDLQSVVKGIQLGAEDYLPKPFEPTLLQARIQSSLEKKRLHDLQDLYLKNLEREMNIARDIQKEFLPAKLPNVTGWDIPRRRCVRKRHRRRLVHDPLPQSHPRRIHSGSILPGAGVENIHARRALTSRHFVDK